jgi:hypothetical protein
MQEGKCLIEKNLFEEYDVLRGELSEKGRRKWAGFQAQRLGHGGKTLVHLLLVSLLTLPPKQDSKFRLNLTSETIKLASKSLTKK